MGTRRNRGHSDGVEHERRQDADRHVPGDDEGAAIPDDERDGHLRNEADAPREDAWGQWHIAAQREALKKDVIPTHEPRDCVVCVEVKLHIKVSKFLLFLIKKITMAKH